MRALPSACATRQRAHERGVAVITALICFFVVMMAGTSVLSLTLFRESAAKSAKDVNMAMVLAETGVDYALYEIQLAHDHAADGVGNVAGSFGSGTYTATVSPAFAGPGAYVITSTGIVHGVRRRIIVDIANEVVSAAFVGRSGVTMSGGLVDSYDSGLGTYASQVSGGFAGSDGRLASNGNIALSGTPTIRGDAVPGPGMAVTGDTSLVSGSIAPAATPITLDPFVYAPPIAATGAHSGSGTFGPGAYRFTSFNVPGGQTVTFSGDVDLYVDGTFTISGSGQAILQATGKLRIYHGTGNFTLSGGGVINQDQKPSNLRVFSATTGSVTCSGSAALYGAVHAPAASGTISGSAGVYGSFQAQSLTLSGGANVHCDVGLAGSAARFTVTAIRPERY